MTENDVKITVFVPHQLRDVAKAKAKATDTSMSQEIRRHLREWVGYPAGDGPGFEELLAQATQGQ